MTCEEARGAFTDLYDGTLSGPPLVDLSRHLDGCVTCRRHWVAFRLTAGALGDLRDEEPPPGFAARVVERIEAPRWWRRLGSSLVLPLRVKLPIHAAALVMLGMAGLWVSQRSPEIQRADDPGAPPVERPATVSPPAPVAGVPAPESKPAPRTRKSAAPVPRPVPPTPAPPAAGKVETPAIVRQEPAAPPPAGAPRSAVEAPTSSAKSRNRGVGSPVLVCACSVRRDRSRVGPAAPSIAAKSRGPRRPGRRTSLFRAATCSPPRSPSCTCAPSTDGGQARQTRTTRRGLSRPSSAQKGGVPAFVSRYPHRRAATALPQEVLA
jgi:hypothetical protein